MSDFLLFLAGAVAGSAVTAAILLPRLRARLATVKLLEARHTSALKERQSLQAELAAAQDALEKRSSEMTAETAELRRRMDELADAIMARGPLTGPGVDNRSGP